MENEQNDKELKSLGFEVISAKKWNERPAGLYIGVEFQAKVPVIENMAVAEVLSRKTKRNTAMYVVDMLQQDGLLSFKIFTKTPPEFSDCNNRLKPNLSEAANLPVFATTFADFCWVLSEGTTNQTKHEVETAIKPNVVLGDLTWILPSKFCDDLIEMTHALNQEMFAGFMENAVMYGPLFLL